MIHRHSIVLIDALKALHAVRTDEVVLTAMGTAREWMTLEPHPLDFIYVPSSMGQATALGLGMALARPDRKIVVCNGDGSMLMNLGSLVTITALAPRNLSILIFDNGVYEVTGAQATPGTAVIRKDGRPFDFIATAKACGFSTVFEFDDADHWQREVKSVIDADGPTFVRIAVTPVPGAVGPRSPSPGAPRAQEFARALQQSAAED
ncbi:MAG: thiamine pyrophosphate-binding protein [Planctomycetes bacterium]|nr:thiamine pyrophosphate-binding protein [Planctomycetota bacterium]